MSAPPWIVAVVCGASGAGKTWVAERLAARYDVPLSAGDDIVTALQAFTTPDQQPLLHYWDTHPEAFEWPPARIAEHHLSVVDSLQGAYRAVVADHVECQAPVVLEGDYLLPELANGFGGQVRAFLLAEPDEDQIVANYLAREPDEAAQRLRAQISVEVNERLTARAHAAGMPVVPARPWADSLDRVDAALRGQG
jgi:2-phosphoglycerate kinase